MKLQHIRLPDSELRAWIVLDDAGDIIRPINLYIHHLLRGNRSPSTVHNYACHLKLFWEYLREQQQQDWTAVTAATLDAFVGWLAAAPGHRQTPRQPGTIATILTVVEGFYEYHRQVGHLAAPIRSTRSLSSLLPATATTGSPRLSVDQVARLIAACDHWRDKLLVRLLYETGTRVGQALGLQHQDIDLDHALIYIVPRPDSGASARRRSRQVLTRPVSEELLDVYRAYVHHEFQGASDYVFVNLWHEPLGRPMTANTVSELFVRLEQRTGIRVHPDMLCRGGPAYTPWSQPGIRAAPSVAAEPVPTLLMDDAETDA